MRDLFGAPDTHNPGGKALPLPAGVMASAIYGGPGDCYRYRLDWTWNPALPRMAAGMMNPSCAGHLCGDNTVAWVHRWSSLRGFGALTVFNASAYRCTNQARLAEVADPTGPDNARHILEAARGAALIVLGYGSPKVAAVRDHGPRMTGLLHKAEVKLHVWRMGKKAPWHPLYLPGDIEAVPWHPVNALRRGR